MPTATPAAQDKAIRSRTFATLADNPDYRKFYLGQGISLIGTWLQQAAVLWIVFEMTGSEWWLGVIDAAGTMPGLFVGLFAGALADHVTPRRMILAMQVGQMTMAFTLAFLVGLGIVQIWQMALILAMARVFVTFEMPSRQVFMYELVGRSSLMNAIALNSGLFNASRVVGPALAGYCLAHFGRTSCFALNGVSYLAAIVALLAIRPRTRAPKPSEQGRGLDAILGGLAYLRADRRVRSLYMLMATFGIVGMGYAALIAAYARLVVKTGALGYSLLLAASGLGATIGALLVASLGGLRRRELLVTSGMAIFGLALAGAGFIPPALSGAGHPTATLWGASACLLVAGFGAIIFYSSTQTLIQTTVPDHLRGRIMGIWMIVFSGSVPLGSLWAGWLARRSSVPQVLMVSSAACILIAAIVTLTGVLAEPQKKEPVPELRELSD